MGISLETNVTSLSQLYYHAVLVSNSNTQIRIAFYHNGQRVATPDANMKFFLTDFARRPQTFDFTSNVTTLQPNSNIWIVGTFVKINQSAMATNEDQLFYAYPNPSAHKFQLSTGSNSPVKVYSMDGAVIYSGSVENCELKQGVYVVEQENQRTKVVIQ